MPALSMVFTCKIFFIFHIFLCFSLTIHPKTQYTYQKRKNSTGRLVFNIRLLPAKGVHGLKTQEICRSHTADHRNHDFVCKEMEFFSKSFPKVFDEFPKGAICILKTKKEKGAKPNCVRQLRMG